MATTLQVGWSTVRFMEGWVFHYEIVAGLKEDELFFLTNVAPPGTPAERVLIALARVFHANTVVRGADVNQVFRLIAELETTYVQLARLACPTLDDGSG